MASTPTTVTPPSTPIMPSTLIEQLNGMCELDQHLVGFDILECLSVLWPDSWCELKFKSGCSSTGSIKNHLNQSVNPEVLEKLLNEAQRETNYPSTSISVQSSPKTPHTPNDSLTPHPYQHYIDTNCTSCVSLVANTKNPTSNKTTSSMLATMPQTSTSNISLNKDTDWIWYWSSRPQMQPPKYVTDSFSPSHLIVFQHFMFSIILQRVEFHSSQQCQIEVQHASTRTHGQQAVEPWHNKQAHIHAYGKLHSWCHIVKANSFTLADLLQINNF